MINPFLTTHTWAMHESQLQAIAQQAAAFIGGDDPNDTTPDSDPFNIVNGIAVMSLTGPLLKYDNFWTACFGGTSTLTTKQNIQTALENPNVNAILLIVDSPGGMVSGTGDLADVIASADKPVWVFISDQCASAAYWISSQADKVFCNPTASVGSIGVYCVLQDTSKMYLEAGVKSILVKAGDFKGVGVSSVPITDDQIADEQRQTDDIYAMFIDAVATGRDITNEQAAELATGQMWIASQAQELGLVDGIASLDEVFTQFLGEVMASKISPFTASVTPAPASAPIAVAPVVEPAAVVVEAPVVATASPVVATVTDAEKLTAANAAGATSERARFNAIKDIAPDHPAFVMEQFAAGSDKSTAAVAYTKLLAAELKAVKASKGIVAEPTGAKAVSLASVEKRDGSGGEAIRSLFKIHKR